MFKNRKQGTVVTQGMWNIQTRLQSIGAIWCTKGQSSEASIFMLVTVEESTLCYIALNPDGSEWSFNILFAWLHLFAK